MRRYLLLYAVVLSMPLFAISQSNQLRDVSTKLLHVDEIKVDEGLKKHIMKSIRLNGLSDTVSYDEFELVFILEIKSRIKEIICANTGFVVSNSIHAMLMHTLSTILLTASSKEDAISQWHEVRLSKDSNLASLHLKAVLQVSPDVIESMYSLTHEYIKNNQNTIVDDVLTRFVDVYKWHDDYQRDQSAHPLRNLSYLRTNGVQINILDDKFSVLQECAARSGDSVLIEHLKNEKVLSINGFMGSKLSLMVHDFFDHFWTFHILDKEGLFDTYKSFLCRCGNPHLTDIFNREGEMIASISFEYRLAHSSHNTDPVISYDEILNLFAEGGALTENQQRAYKILCDRTNDKKFRAYFAQVYSSIITELMEQRKNFGFIKDLDATYQPHGHMRALDLEYLAFIVEAYCIIESHHEQAMKFVLNTVLILENYLCCLLDKSKSHVVYTITLEDVENFEVASAHISKTNVQWLSSHLESLSNRDHMNTEFEAKFFPINKGIFRKVLAGAGAHLEKPELRMKRTIYELGDSSKRKWLRVRDEGDVTKITIKEIIDAQAIDGIREIEIETNDFEKSLKLFDSLGLKIMSYQENDRETWRYLGATITIDTWPGLDPILEIEGDSSEHVQQVVRSLHLDFNDAQFGAIDRLYEQKHGISLHVFNNIKHLSFDTIEATLVGLKK